MMHWYDGAREQNEALVIGVVALEHCGEHFSGGARALWRQIWTHRRSNGGKIKGIKLSGRSKNAGVGTGVNAGARPGAMKNFPRYLVSNQVQCYE